MVSFKDGSSSASDADIIRTQIESLLEIMLVQVRFTSLEWFELFEVKRTDFCVSCRIELSSILEARNWMSFASKCLKPAVYFLSIRHQLSLLYVSDIPIWIIVSGRWQSVYCWRCSWQGASAIGCWGTDQRNARVGYWLLHQKVINLY